MKYHVEFWKGLDISPGKLYPVYECGTIHDDAGDPRQRSNVNGNDVVYRVELKSDEK